MSLIKWVNVQYPRPSIMVTSTVTVVGYTIDGDYIAVTTPDPGGYFWFWTWHMWSGEVFRPHNCPTWNEVTECKCMLAPEDQ